MRLHPALLILTWCVFVSCMQRASHALLMALTLLTLCVGWWLARGKMLQLIHRTRWIMASLLLIYAYSTPGQALWPSLGMWSPVYEGLQDGVVQLLRLLAALAGLALLLHRLHRLELIAGLYSLFAPLRCMGVSRERCAIRLALTLHYAEVAMLRKPAGWQDALHGLFETHDESHQAITLPLHVWTGRDMVWGGVLVITIMGLVLR